MLVISYINNCGLESTWDYTSSSAGRAGTGYVNDYTGNLVWVHTGLGFSGNRMPVSINAVYNANDKRNKAYGLGYGWRTNYNQRVEQITLGGTTYYRWEDEDGTRHYFMKKSAGLYVDELEPTRQLTDTGSGTKNSVSQKRAAANAISMPVDGWPDSPITRPQPAVSLFTTHRRITSRSSRTALAANTDSAMTAAAT